ncbi:hypothetical protein CTI12_AA548950 [Artemisia annua]|uniref:Uncharacterized protein n=1 Tax=Artemisia annua TaxID=35608 RepID=A0A2U1KYZ6_ARTAN|nr:hypothetical protein CTI12_AA548950 [Artemisia annua]
MEKKLLLIHISCTSRYPAARTRVYTIPIMTTEAHIKDLKPRDRNKILEGKIYRAWIHRDPPDTTDKGYRAILLDKQVNGSLQSAECDSIFADIDAHCT